MSNNYREGEPGSSRVNASENESDQEVDAQSIRRRKRGSRGGRGRKSAIQTDLESGSSNAESSVATKVRRMPRRTSSSSDEAAQDISPNAKNASAQVADQGGRRKPKIGDSIPAAKIQPESGNEKQDTQNRLEDSSEKPGKRKRSRKRRSAAKRAAEQASKLEASSDQDNETLPTNRKKGRQRNGKPLGRYTMCVRKTETATQIAILEGRNLIEAYLSRPHDDVSQIDGNIYLARVQNVLPGMEAAFVDIGTPKNAVLYRGDVRYDADELADGSSRSTPPKIEDMIKSGQTILCQVTKNPIGLKGARLTQEVSIPGRFVVLMPNSSTYGISKRLPDNERRRLRRYLDRVKPAEHGLIVRTAAEGASAEELERDVNRLLKTWSEIDQKAKKSEAPQLLYREPEMAVRMIREEFNAQYKSVLIDDEQLHIEVKDYVSGTSPELIDRIEHYDVASNQLDIFERFHVTEQLRKAMDRKVWLPSGGSLIIERTEALTVIDVNTGKNVGKSNLEETVFKNNLEAAVEIARQLRLRDIGGIIVIDFIDMEVLSNRDEVLACLRDALSRDKTRTHAYPIGELGLVEMTRKRISEGLVESYSEVCSDCEGTGFVLDSELLDN